MLVRILWLFHSSKVQPYCKQQLRKPCQWYNILASSILERKLEVECDIFQKLCTRIYGHSHAEHNAEIHGCDLKKEKLPADQYDLLDI